MPVPQDIPWFPKGIKDWSVRWVILHVINELTRHSGHADIIRESIDGATMYELLAALEGWSIDGWVQPWKSRSRQCRLVAAWLAATPTTVPSSCITKTSATRTIRPSC